MKEITPKEAWKIINDYGIELSNGDYSQGYMFKITYTSFHKAHDLIENLVAKSEPMKPIVEIDEALKNKGASKFDYTDYRCPRCKKYIGYHHYFCPEKDCGQAIDWSELK